MELTTNPGRSEFAALLRQLRLAAGLTQDALAERSSVGTRTIQDLEGGAHRPLEKTLRQLIVGLALEHEDQLCLESAGRPTPRQWQVNRHSPLLAAEPKATAKAHAPRRALSAQLTSFVGRAAEVAAIAARLREKARPGRLLTLTGTGGCGKTRLALRVAEEVQDDYRHGVRLVDLSALTDSSLVVDTVAAAVGTISPPEGTILASLIEDLRTRRLLLVLDNCEHLLNACARLVVAILEGCPGVAVLATSREQLGIAGETSWRVPSLATPPADCLGSLADVAEFDAIRLFVERARAVQPRFALTARNALAVAQLCGRLDGIPLAIELAAARLRVLSVEQIVSRLDNRFSLLTSGPRLGLPRHQTLRAAIDWSHDLLSDQERCVFRRLATFAGGFTLDAAEAICSGRGLEKPDVLELLTHLVDKSLVQVEADDTCSRYRLLELVRQYARGKLEESGESGAVRAQHRDWFLALAERAEPELWGSEATAVLQKLATEHDNLRAALEWCQQNDRVVGLRLAASLWVFWLRRGHLAEGRRWLGLMLDLAPRDAPGRASALMGAGVLARDQGEMATATALLEESLRLHREARNREGIASALNWLGLQSQVAGDYQRARLLLEESLAIGRDIGNRSTDGFTLGHLSSLARLQGDVAESQSRGEEMYHYFRENDNPLGAAVALHNLGELALFVGDFARARGFLTMALDRRRDIGDQRGAAYAISCLGDLARMEGDLPLAKALLDEALGIFRANNFWESGQTLVSLGDVARSEGEFFQAASYLREGLAILRRAGHRRGISRSLWFAGMVAFDRGDPGRAAQLFAAAAAHAPAGVPFEPAERSRHDAGLAAVQAALPEVDFAQMWGAGHNLSLDRAITTALDITEIARGSAFPGPSPGPLPLPI